MTSNSELRALLREGTTGKEAVSMQRTFSEEEFKRVIERAGRDVDESAGERRYTAAEIREAATEVGAPADAVDEALAEVSAESQALASAVAVSPRSLEVTTPPVPPVVQKIALRRPAAILAAVAMTLGFTAQFFRAAPTLAAADDRFGQALLEMAWILTGTPAKVLVLGGVIVAGVVFMMAEK
jgi:hypothetical protein